MNFLLLQSPAHVGRDMSPNSIYISLEPPALEFNKGWTKTDNRTCSNTVVLGSRGPESKLGELWNLLVDQEAISQHTDSVNI